MPQLSSAQTHADAADSPSKPDLCLLGGRRSGRDSRRPRRADSCGNGLARALDERDLDEPAGEQAEAKAVRRSRDGRLDRHMHPSPCTDGTMASSWSSITVDDGSGTQDEDDAYKIYRPSNLTNSSANKVPAVIWLDEQTSPNAIANWESLAVANRFVLVVYRPGTYRFARASAALFFDPLSVPWQPIPIPNCGANQEGSCDDKPGLITLVNSVVRTPAHRPEEDLRHGRVEGRRLHGRIDVQPCGRTCCSEDSAS